MRTNVRLLAVSLLLGLCATARGGGEDSWLPAKEGWKWTYDLRKVAKVGGIVSTKKKGTVTCVCKGVEKIGDKEYAVLEWSGGEGEDAVSLKIWVHGSDAGVTVHKASHHELLVVPADAKEKKNLKVEVTTDKEKLTVESEHATAEEEVETPAGKYKALKVTSSCTTTGAITTKRTVWYAKGVGVVKVVKEAHVGGITADKELVLTALEKGEKAGKK